MALGQYTDEKKDPLPVNLDAETALADALEMETERLEVELLLVYSI